MVDLYPQPYTTASPIVASFDFTDIASGTGFEEYLLMSTEDSAATNYILTEEEARST